MRIPREAGRDIRGKAPDADAKPDERERRPEVRQKPSTKIARAVLNL